MNDMPPQQESARVHRLRCHIARNPRDLSSKAALERALLSTLRPMPTMLSMPHLIHIENSRDCQVNNRILPDVSLKSKLRLKNRSNPLPTLQQRISELLMELSRRLEIRSSSYMILRSSQAKIVYRIPTGSDVNDRDPSQFLPRVPIFLYQLLSQKLDRQRSVRTHINMSMYWVHGLEVARFFFQSRNINLYFAGDISTIINKLYEDVLTQNLDSGSSDIQICYWWSRSC